MGGRSQPAGAPTPRRSVWTRARSLRTLPQRGFCCGYGFRTATAVDTTGGATRPRPSTRGFAASQPAAWLRWSGPACAARVIRQIAVCRGFFNFGISAFFRTSATRFLAAPRGAGDPRGTRTYPSTALCGPGARLWVERRTGPRRIDPHAMPVEIARSWLDSTNMSLEVGQRVIVHRKRLEDACSEPSAPGYSTHRKKNQHTISCRAPQRRHAVESLHS